ncbi:IclR family transcriptional regulator [Limnochorda pilosa]|uniref:Glycerol operon regulatory protein n=1 Tax=Limnochorda pilosa TaxID=1555112 RepID=A0A0K2SM15_LIMPI|nr:IclR family transcriptional regulator [Limnochorda pilosa]BAS28153.1 IclR family transcriptional regulator [Limnochorda pilosa]
MRPSTGQYLQTVARAMDLLNCFQEVSEWSLSELARHLGLSKTVTFRLAATLASKGYLEQDPVTKRYRLGARPIVLGLAAAQRLDVREVARPILQRLTDETGETAFLTVVRGLQSVCLDKVDSPHNVRLTMQAGGVYALHLGASNKILLAYLTPAKIERYLQEHAERLTAEGIVPDALLKELAKIRHQGYAFTTEEVTPQAFSIGCPVFDAAGNLAGAISLAGPTYRLPWERLQELVDATRAGAAEVTGRMGGVPHKVEGVV